jgi:hypothetical protein
MFVLWSRLGPARIYRSCADVSSKGLTLLLAAVAKSDGLSPTRLLDAPSGRGGPIAAPHEQSGGPSLQDTAR